MPRDNLLQAQRTVVSKLWRAVLGHKLFFFYSALLDLIFLSVAATFNVALVDKLTSLMYVLGGLLSRPVLDSPDRRASSRS